jgi:hypothetical protein
LQDAFAQPGANSPHHRIAIDRRTIEKTWKYMDKVKTNLLMLMEGYVSKQKMTSFKELDKNNFTQGGHREVTALGAYSQYFIFFIT